MLEVVLSASIVATNFLVPDDPRRGSLNILFVGRGGLGEPKKTRMDATKAQERSGQEVSRKKALLQEGKEELRRSGDLSASKGERKERPCLWKEVEPHTTPRRGDIKRDKERVF